MQGPEVRYDSGCVRRARRHIGRDRDRRNIPGEELPDPDLRRALQYDETLDLADVEMITPCYAGMGQRVGHLPGTVSPDELGKRSACVFVQHHRQPRVNFEPVGAKRIEQLSIEGGRKRGDRHSAVLVREIGQALAHRRHCHALPIKAHLLTAASSVEALQDARCDILGMDQLDLAVFDNRWLRAMS